MTEPINMPFGFWTQLGLKNYVLDGGQDPSPCKGAILRGKGRPIL